MKSPAAIAIPRSSEGQALEIALDSRRHRAVGDWGIRTRPAEQARRLLRVLTDGLRPELLLELRAFRRDPARVLQRWFGLRQIEAAAKWCMTTAEAGFDVYAAVQPRAAREGGASAVAVIVSLYADLDCGPGKRLPDKSAALARLRSFALLGLSPAVLVDSGHGYHAYWPLREPLDSDERPAWQRVMRAIACALDADPSVTDLPRILRVPGTVNWKSPETPEPVRLLHLDAVRRFTLLDFDGLPELPRRDEQRAVHIPITSAGTRVIAAIRAAGGRVHEKRDAFGKVVALVLDEPCPCCPGRPLQAEPSRGGTAHVAPRSGALRCKRALCKAGAAATGQTADGEARGLSLEQWSARFAPAAIATVLAPRSIVTAPSHLPTLARLPSLRRHVR